MSAQHTYPFPQVFLVDGGGSPPGPEQPPGLIPCWSFPPAQERARAPGRRSGVGACAQLAVLMLFLLVFTALGFQAYQIFHLQRQLRDIRPSEAAAAETKTPQKQIGAEPGPAEVAPDRAVAHVIGRIETEGFRETLRWEHRVGQAFQTGGVRYWVQDGALQVNQSGLYHVYSRVELIFKTCSSTTSFVHSVFVRRKGHSSPLTLMVAHRAGFCPQRSHASWTSDSFLASVVRLQEDDRVLVNVSQPSLISHESYGNFFGLYVI